MDLACLITTLTPLYNGYKSGIGKTPPVESIGIMWDIGDVLRKAIFDSGSRPHTLFREVYGRSEGTANIKQKSYIPREFQGRCYRVRLMFPERSDIVRQYPNLCSLTCFREAMPFLDNPKYALKGQNRDALLSLLNSASLSPVEVMSRVKTWQEDRIHVTNPRTQHLGEMADARGVFVRAYNVAHGLIRASDWDAVRTALADMPKEDLRLLSRNTSALATEGLRMYKMPEVQSKDNTWTAYFDLIKGLTERPNEKERRRFRRVVPPERISRMAEMIFALTDEEAFETLARGR